MVTALRVNLLRVDVFVYGVYFLSIVVLVFCVFAFVVVCVHDHFKSDIMVTGGVQIRLMLAHPVDSYTNITTVKLFSHTRRESDYAQDAMDGFIQTVYPQMRLVTVLNVSVWINNALLVAGMTGMALYLWQLGMVTAGDIAIAVSLSLRLNGMSQWVMWEVSSLFEHIGTVQDGINTLSHPISVQDESSAKPLSIQKGQIDFANIQYGYDDQKPIFDALALNIKPGEKVGLVGRSGAGKSTLVNLLLRFYDLQSGKIVTTQDFALYCMVTASSNHSRKYFIPDATAVARSGS